MNFNLKVALIASYMERDLKTLAKIRKKLIQSGTTEVQIFPVNSPQFINDILDFAPNVIMTYPFTAISTSYKFYVIKFFLNCYILTYRTEGILPLETPPHINAMIGLERYGETLVDYEIFWGYRTSQIVGRSLYDQKKISSMKRINHLGWPYFEDYFTPTEQIEEKLPEYISLELNKRNKLKNILFVSGFLLADYSDNDLIRAGDMVDIRNNDNSRIQEEFNVHKQKVLNLQKFRQLWINTLIECATKHPEVLFVSKMHPLEIVVCKNKEISPYAELKKYSNILLIEENISFRLLIPFCSILFHYGSTTLLESYVSKVPTVSIFSDFFPTVNEFGASSTLEIDIKNIPIIVQHHLIQPILFQKNLQLEMYLEEQIDLTIGEEYKPSEKIANFILSVKRSEPLNILANDPYLINAMRSSTHFIGNLVNKAIELIQGGHYLKALTIFLDRALIIANYANTKIENINYFRSICYFKLNNLKMATDTLKEELKNFPNNVAAKQLLNTIHDRFIPSHSL